MGTDYTVYAVIGIRIDPKQLAKTKRIRLCKHPEQATPFCPECGKKMWDEQTILLTEDDLDDLRLPVQACWSTDHSELYLGYVVSNSDMIKGRGHHLPDIATLKDNIRQSLQRLNLPTNDVVLQVWAVMSCSY